jgi:hypothetical protein
MTDWSLKEIRWDLLDIGLTDYSDFFLQWRIYCERGKIMGSRSDF